MYHPWMVIDLGEPMTVTGVQIQRRSGYDPMNKNEYVSAVRVATSMVEPEYPPVNLGTGGGAFGNRLRPDAAPYQKGGEETTLFWTGYDIDAVGWADVRFRDSVLARYVKIFAYECNNHCSMRARVRVIKRDGCFTTNFYMVGGEAFRKMAKVRGGQYKVRDFAKDHLMGTNPVTGQLWPLRNATSAVECQQRCLNSVGCEYFTYFRGKAEFAVGNGVSLEKDMQAKNLCFLQNRDAVPLPLRGRIWNGLMAGVEPLPPLLDLLAASSRTGTKFCHSGGPGMRVQSSNLHRRAIVFSPKECQKLCEQTDECEYFSFWADGGCSLFRKHAKKLRNSLTGVAVWSASKTCTSGSRTSRDFLKGIFTKKKKIDNDFDFCFTQGQRYTGGRQVSSFGTLDDGMGYAVGTSVFVRFSRTTGSSHSLYVKTPRECQLRCATTPSCYYFTHRDVGQGYCHLQTYDAVLSTGTLSPVGWAGGTVTSGGRICRETSGSSRYEDFLLADWEIKVVCDSKISSYHLQFYSEERDPLCKDDKDRRLLKCKVKTIDSLKRTLVRKCDGLAVGELSGSTQQNASGTATDNSGTEDAVGAGVLWSLEDTFDSTAVPNVPEECEQEQPPSLGAAEVPKVPAECEQEATDDCCKRWMIVLGIILGLLLLLLLLALIPCCFCGDDGETESRAGMDDGAWAPGAGAELGDDEEELGLQQGKFESFTFNEDEVRILETDAIQRDDVEKLALADGFTAAGAKKIADMALNGDKGNDDDNLERTPEMNTLDLAILANLGAFGGVKCVGELKEYYMTRAARKRDNMKKGRELRESFKRGVVASGVEQIDERYYEQALTAVGFSLAYAKKLAAKLHDADAVQKQRNVDEQGETRGPSSSRAPSGALTPTTEDPVQVRFASEMDDQDLKLLKQLELHNEYESPEEIRGALLFAASKPNMFTRRDNSEKLQEPSPRDDGKKKLVGDDVRQIVTPTFDEAEQCALAAGFSAAYARKLAAALSREDTLGDTQLPEPDSESDKQLLIALKFDVPQFGKKEDIDFVRKAWTPVVEKKRMYKKAATFAADANLVSKADFEQELLSCGFTPEGARKIAEELVNLSEDDDTNTKPLIAPSTKYLTAEDAVKLRQLGFGGTETAAELKGFLVAKKAKDARKIANASTKFLPASSLLSPAATAAEYERELMQAGVSSGAAARLARDLEDKPEDELAQLKSIAVDYGADVGALAGLGFGEAEAAIIVREKLGRRILRKKKKERFLHKKELAKNLEKEGFSPKFAEGFVGALNDTEDPAIVKLMKNAEISDRNLLKAVLGIDPDTVRDVVASAGSASKKGKKKKKVVATSGKKAAASAVVDDVVEDDRSATTDSEDNEDAEGGSGVFAGGKVLGDVKKAVRKHAVLAKNKAPLSLVTLQNKKLATTRVRKLNNLADYERALQMQGFSPAYRKNLAKQLADTTQNELKAKKDFVLERKKELEKLTEQVQTKPGFKPMELKKKKFKADSFQKALTTESATDKDRELLKQLGLFGPAEKTTAARNFLAKVTPTKQELQVMMVEEGLTPAAAEALWTVQGFFTRKWREKKQDEIVLDDDEDDDDTIAGKADEGSLGGPPVVKRKELAMLLRMEEELIDAGMLSEGGENLDGGKHSSGPQNENMNLNTGWYEADIFDGLD
eukprot:g1231.t1